MRGHADSVAEARFSSDGTKVLTSYFDGTARIWPLRGHTSIVKTARFSQDGKYLVTASDDGSARIWLTDGTGEPLVLRSGENDRVYWAEFSPDRTRVLAVSSSGPAINNLTARVWTTGWKELVTELRERTCECHSVEQRLRYLGEGSEDAAARYAECERGFGRSPAQK